MQKNLDIALPSSRGETASEVAKCSDITAARKQANEQLPNETIRWCGALAVYNKKNQYHKIFLIVEIKGLYIVMPTV